MIHRPGGRLGGGGDRLGVGRRLVIFLGVGIGQRVAQAFAAEPDDEAVLFSGEETDGDPGRRLELRVQPGAQLLVLGGRDAAGPAVDDQPVFESGIVAPGDEVVIPDLDSRTQGLEDAPSELVTERIIAEQGEVGRSASGRYAGEDRVGQAAGGLFGQPVEVGFPGPLEGRQPRCGQVAHAVQNKKDDLRRRRDRQFSNECFPVHSSSLSYEVVRSITKLAGYQFPIFPLLHLHPCDQVIGIGVLSRRSPGARTVKLG